MPGSQDFVPDTRNKELLVLLNDKLVPAHEAQVSLFDAGFALGDGVWEGLRLHKGALLFLEAHLDRLYRGAAALRIDIGKTTHRDSLRAGAIMRALGWQSQMVWTGEKSARVWQRITDS